MIIIKAAIKINLFLHVVDRYENGYHALNSLVAFCNLYDYLKIIPADKFSVEIIGELSEQLKDSVKNNKDDILYKTKNLFEQHTGLSLKHKILLDKNIPIAAGLGGGSADSAAYLKFLSQEYKISFQNLLDIAVQIGADVPMCLSSQTCFVENIGEKITLVNIPNFYIVLINPRVTVNTPEIFKKFKNDNIVFSPKIDFSKFVVPNNYLELIKFLNCNHNDLLMPAISVRIEIQQILNALYRTNKKLQLSQDITYISMAGSGPTCFSIYQTNEQAQNAYNILTKNHPQWWIKICNNI